MERETLLTRSKTIIKEWRFGKLIFGSFRLSGLRFRVDARPSVHGSALRTRNIWWARVVGGTGRCISRVYTCDFPSEHAWKWDLRVLFGVLRGSEARCFQPRKEDFAVCHYRCGFLVFPIRMTNLIQYQTLFLFCFIRIKVLTKPHDSLKTRGIAISAYSCTVFTLDAVTFLLFFMHCWDSRPCCGISYPTYCVFLHLAKVLSSRVYPFLYTASILDFFPRFKDVSRITLSSITALSILAFNYHFKRLWFLLYEISLLPQLFLPFSL